MKDKYYRWQSDPIREALKTSRVILLSGARQCGKTTLAKSFSSPDTDYRTLDDVSLREMALSDPKGFVNHAGKLLIIDEVQRAPDLLSAVKLVVDQSNQPGQFLLTGSANIQSLPNTQESLAGRVRNIRLRGLTQAEILGMAPDFLKNAFEQKFYLPKTSYDRLALLCLGLRGGFPEVVRLEEKYRGQWHKDYLRALLQHDLKDIAHIQRLDAMRSLTHILAAWSGKLMDLSAIGAGLSIRRPTIETYINALSTMYLVESVPPYTSTDYERVGKQAKLYMTDSGLMSSILRWRKDEVGLNSDRSGKLIETFIFNELAALIDLDNEKYELYHYRDREKREIDFIIERDDGALLGVEVKAGSTISSNDFKHLRWFQENLVKKSSFVGIVLYSGEYIGRMGENLWAVPTAALWGG